MSRITSFLTKPVSVTVLIALLTASLIYNGIQYLYIQLTENHLKSTFTAYEFMRDRYQIAQSDLDAALERPGVSGGPSQVRSPVNHRERAYDEIRDVINIAQQYRQVNGGYDGLDNIAVLVDNGYGLQMWSDGEAENAYGKDVTIAESSGNAEVTYGFDDEQGCTQIAARLAAQNTSLSGLDADNPGDSCDSDFVLTFQVN